MKYVIIPSLTKIIAHSKVGNESEHLFNQCILYSPQGIDYEVYEHEEYGLWEIAHSRLIDEFSHKLTRCGQ